MTKLGNIVLAVIGVCAVLGALAFFNLTPFRNAITQLVSGSPAGTTFNTAKIASVSMSPSSAAGTSTSILNTDASARWFASFGMAGCTGVGTSQTFTTGTGLANFVIQAATTTVPNQGLQGNTNYALNMTVPTSTPFANVSSSTPAAAFGYWAPGTYLTFTTNATNTAACVFEVDYVAS